MAKSYKLSGTGNYVDASGVIYNKKELPNYLHDVIDNLTSTSGVNALSANQGKVLYDRINGVTLYNNSNGTSGTITLSQDATTFASIEIFYIDKTGYNQNSKLIEETGNGEEITLDSVTLPGNEELIRIAGQRRQIGTTTITTQFQATVHIFGGVINAHTADSKIHVEKVVGYNHF